MSSEVTFESGGKMWKYKDKPRRIEPGEYYLSYSTYNPAEVRLLTDGVSTMGHFVPVEPAEPMEVTVTLPTNVAKLMEDNIRSYGQFVVADFFADKLREQGVQI